MPAPARAFKTGRLRRRSHCCEREQMLLTTTPSASIGLVVEAVDQKPLLEADAARVEEARVQTGGHTRRVRVVRAGRRARRHASLTDVHSQCE